ncbi:MAG: T9SS C-terminal target domain-containing protein, partial [Methanobacteriota archaeon]
EDSGVHTVVSDVSTVFADPDPGDILSYSVSSSNPNIIVSLVGSALQLTSSANFYGSGSVMLTATDSSGLSASDTFLVTITPVNDPPIINGLPDTLRFNLDTTFSIWNYVDDVETPDSLLRYQFSFSNDSMSVSYDSLTGLVQLSAQIGFNGESQFHLTVSDDSNAVARDSILLQIGTQPISFIASFSEGWNLIGLPLKVNNGHYLTLFPGATPGTLFGWDGNYTSQDTLRPGQGYWLRFPTADTITIQGTNMQHIPLTIRQGWNLISGVSTDVAFTDITDSLGILIPGTLYGFNGSYFSTDTLRQGEGYWIRASDSGQVDVSQLTRILKRREVLLSPEHSIANLQKGDHPIKLEISDGIGHRRELMWMTNHDSGDSLDGNWHLFYSLPPQPPPGGFDARFEEDTWLTIGSTAVISLQVNYYPISIRFHNLSFGNQYIVEASDGINVIETHRIHNQTPTAAISNPAVNKLILHIGKSVPHQFRLMQNFPNPFNPKTIIKYQLPANSRVKLEIFNLLGQRIRTLVNELQMAGEYSAEWNGKNEHGRSVASGVYIYRLRATVQFKSFKNKNQIILWKKMVLIR